MLVGWFEASFSCCYAVAYALLRCAVLHRECITWQGCIALCKVMLNTLSEADYTKKKKKMESKAALYIRATFIAICSKRQVSLLNLICHSFHCSVHKSEQHSTCVSTCFDCVRFKLLPCCVFMVQNSGQNVFKMRMLNYTRMYSCAYVWTWSYDSSCSAKHTGGLALTGC